MEWMLRFLELARDAVVGTVTQLVAWVQGLAAAGAFDPRSWHPAVWLGLALVLLVGLALAWRRRHAAPRDLPEMLVSHGEIALVSAPDEADADGYGLAAPPRAQHRLELTLSNLNAYPVQLLELAVRTRGLRMPVVAEAGSVVAPNGAVDVVAELFDLPGDAGVVELYLYSSRGRRRTYRLSAPLEWEPWAQRYRVRGLALKVAPVKVLASQERRRRERRSFRSAKRRERQRELAEAAWRRAEDLSRQVRERRAQASEQRRAAAERPAPAAYRATEPDAYPAPARGAPGEAPRAGRSAPSGVHAVETVYSGAAAPGADVRWSGATTVAEPAARDEARHDVRHDARHEARHPEEAVAAPFGAPPRPAAGEREGGHEPNPEPSPEPPDEQRPRRRLEFPDEF